MHSVPLPQFHRSPALAPQAAVHQPCDRAHAPGVLPMLPIPLRHDLKAPHAPDRVLHDDPPLGEGAVVGHIRRWTWFAAWLAAWRRAQPLRMQRSHADIGQVTQAADARWQPQQQPRHGQQGEVSGRSAYGGVTSTMRPVVSSTATCVLSVCCFFLPLSIRVHREANTWALHGLLKGVDNDGQVRRVGQRSVQRAPVFLARIGQAHGVAAGGFQQRQHAPKHPSDRGMRDAKQEAQDRMHGIQAQPDDGEQKLVARLGGEGRAAANSRWRVGRLKRSCLRA